MNLKLQIIIKLLRQPFVSTCVVSCSWQPPQVIFRRSVGISGFVGRLFIDFGIGGFLSRHIVGWVVGCFSVRLTRYEYAGLLILCYRLSCSSPHFVQVFFSVASVCNNAKDNQEDHTAKSLANNPSNIALRFLGCSFGGCGCGCSCCCRAISALVDIQRTHQILRLVAHISKRIAFVVDLKPSGGSHGCN